MNEREMIEKLKFRNPDRPPPFFGELTPKEQEFLKEHKEDCERMIANGYYYTLLSEREIQDCNRFRLRPDYEPEPEPEIEECEVFVSDDWPPRLLYSRQGRAARELDMAIRDPDFIRAVDKAGGTVPLRGMFGKSDRNEPADWPKKLLFRR